MEYIASALLTFIVLLVRLFGGQSEQKSTVISTSFGPIEGEKFSSVWTSQHIYAFKGIPYASPPVGTLRFKDPVPPRKWSQVKDCTKEQAICPQTPHDQSTEQLLMSEDCLYLNVYSPQLPSPRHELLPVLVWIHGGGFTEGSGNYDQAGPDLLVVEGIVFVSLNYRLGALGFLNLGVRDTPGNAGLKDQRLALLWVQSEIRHFGGDPSRVTIFGESAGAVCVHLHYLSPLSVGLFHRGIRNSGSALAYSRVREDGSRFAHQLAKELGCDTDNTTKILACLRSADYKNIMKAQSLVKAPQDDKTGLSVFVPTIDRHTSEKPFLPDFPFNLEKQRTESAISFLMGVNSDEGIIRLFKDIEEIKNITNNLEHLYALQVPGKNRCPPKLRAEKLKQYYFRDTEPLELNVTGFVDIYTDVLYAYPTMIDARDYQNRGKVFLYQLSFNGKFKSEGVKKLEEKYNISGVCHAEDLNYLFVKSDVDQRAVGGPNEFKTWRRMVKLWTNFVKYGTPTVGPDPLLQDIEWLPTKAGKTFHLHIDVNLEMRREDLLASRVALWDSITFHDCL